MQLLLALFAAEFIRGHDTTALLIGLIPQRFLGRKLCQFHPLSAQLKRHHGDSGRYDTSISTGGGNIIRTSRDRPYDISRYSVILIVTIQTRMTLPG